MRLSKTLCWQKKNCALILLLFMNLSFFFDFMKRICSKGIECSILQVGYSGRGIECLLLYMCPHLVILCLAELSIPVSHRLGLLVCGDEHLFAVLVPVLHVYPVSWRKVRFHLAGYRQIVCLRRLFWLLAGYHLPLVFEDWLFVFSIWIWLF
jgi:hypothetical protein